MEGHHRSDRPQGEEPKANSESGSPSGRPIFQIWKQQTHKGQVAQRRHGWPPPPGKAAAPSVQGMTQPPVSRPP
ncbi:putative Dresden prostate carcinoma protein 2 [Manis javanica]|nr:putative Dresden prostate carcinoma protein 2 [Manis javanica]